MQDVVAIQFGSPVWSPTRGLYSEISLIEGAVCKRSTGKHDDDFAFIRDDETSRNSENNARNRISLCKMENVSKKSTLSMDNITLVRHRGKSSLILYIDIGRYFSKLIKFPIHILSYYSL